VTPPPEPLGHHGWTGVSDPMPRGVFRDGCGTALAVKTLRWHQHQAHHRALQIWATDPRRNCWLPCESTMSYLPAAFDASVDVRVRLHLKPFMLHPDWDVPAHPPTWLVELVDGPLSGTTYTLPRVDGETQPPWRIDMDPRPQLGGPPQQYHLREIDMINSAAYYTVRSSIVTGGGDPIRLPIPPKYGAADLDDGAL